MQVHRIELPTPFPVGPVNAYLLEGDPLTLIDAGPKTEAARAALEDGLARAGRRVEEIRRIILTHGHTDHFGNAVWIRDRSGAEIYAHPAEGPKLAGARWVGDHLRRHFLLSGLPDAFLTAFLDRMRAVRTLFDPVTEFRPLQDGATVEIAGDGWRVLHCPGHSIGHVCLFHLDGVLIAGDLLLADISPNPVVEFTEDGRRIAMLPRYLQSLRRILLLNCERAHPGHGATIGNPGARIRELISHHEQRKEEIYRRLGRRPKTLFELTGELYQHLDEINLTLALSEVIGHLDLLAEEKRVQAVRRGVAFGFRAR
ncbi:MAG: MBL fold metallo-hydrolase [Armatimonadota bacterium]|nr:MBL fold metallo-hydrolase [Armatimonadota bacterium]MDR7450826.1 MBL fold metallo-hydrolase [Armatimonadota bacterium]MDR7465747.1 MBL fold metallo-hydrolase [Armatimonadota bacterium]MDR7493655.1 MBL fold metallo-hydrolase [Armatimonadota bacterium]MDR7499096.1 MBL fold metallo-hydrolase [Armatimonadota bacterium]